MVPIQLYQRRMSHSYIKNILTMKKLLVIISVLCALTAVAQNKKRFIYYLSNKLESVPKEEATILGKGLMENGLLKLDCYAVADSYLLLTAHYTDSSLYELEGLFTTYHPNGDVAKEGVYKASKKEGIWQQWDSLGYKTDSAQYVLDKEIIAIKWGYTNKGTLGYKTITDNLADTYQSIGYDSAMNIIRKVEFKGQRGLLTTYTGKGVTTDSLFTRKEQEAEFPGGDEGWRVYLEKNLDPEVPIYMKAPAGIYKVKVQFIVNQDGSISDIRALTNHGYGMEKEVVRIMKKSPLWIPAVQYGRKVKAYRLQPVTFVVYDKQ
jgi:Gram-negative bacterial TonB protein C-terminal